MHPDTKIGPSCDSTEEDMSCEDQAVLDTRIPSLKEVIQDLSGIPPASQLLFFRGHTVKLDDSTLRSYEITNGSTVSVKKRSSARQGDQVVLSCTSKRRNREDALRSHGQQVARLKGISHSAAGSARRPVSACARLAWSMPNWQSGRAAKHSVATVHLEKTSPSGMAAQLSQERLAMTYGIHDHDNYYEDIDGVGDEVCHRIRGSDAFLKPVV
jgi:hypothetical protein